MPKVIFYHAACPVSITAGQALLKILCKSDYEMEIVNIDRENDRITEAEEVGVESVPALVIDNIVLHINFGASIEDVKKSNDYNNCTKKT